VSLLLQMQDSVILLPLLLYRRREVTARLCNENFPLLQTMVS
jgi:hypothetical protein